MQVSAAYSGYTLSLPHTPKPNSVTGIACHRMQQHAAPRVHRPPTALDTVPAEGCPVPSPTASSCLSLCRRAGGRTWSDEVLDTVSVATEAGHVDGEHAIGTMPAGGGGAGGGDRWR